MARHRDLILQNFCHAAGVGLVERYFRFLHRGLPPYRAGRNPDNVPLLWDRADEPRRAVILDRFLRVKPQAVSMRHFPDHSKALNLLFR